MNFDLQFFQENGVHLAFKFGFLTVVFFVVIFLFVVMRQIYSMNRIITEQELLPYLIFFNFLLIGVTIVLFVAGVVIL